jgi:hypothetical protein
MLLEGAPAANDNSSLSSSILDVQLKLLSVLLAG